MREYWALSRVDYTQRNKVRAPGSVKFRTGGDSPRLARWKQRATDLVEFRDRR